MAGEDGWTGEWLRNRTSFGAYYTLLAELRSLNVVTNRDLLVVPSNTTITANALPLTSRFL